jgi:hypothetical protein
MKFCLLYKNGGMYLDIDHVFNNNIELMDILNTELWVSFGNQNREIYTGFFICKKNDKRLLDTIKRIVKYMKSDKINDFESGASFLYKSFNNTELVQYKYEENKSRSYIKNIKTNDIIIFI